MPIYLFCQAKKILLTSKKTKISAKYFNFSNVFSSNITEKLPKYININNHFINWVDDKHSTYRLIYRLEVMKLETLKT